MSKNFYLYILIILLISSCGIIIVPGQWENPDDHKIESNTSPSTLIGDYINIPFNGNGNYCLTFFDIYCGYSYQQISYINKLYDLTNTDYHWSAITLYDSLSEVKYKQKAKLDESIRYKFSTFYEINGLKSSLRNLYYNNDIPHEDMVPMTIIIYNDTVRKIIRGSINSEEKYSKFKSYLDSLSGTDI